MKPPIRLRSFEDTEKKDGGEAAKTDILVVNKVMMNNNDLTFKILKCCYTVHSELGPGLLEKIYQKALHTELIQIGFLVDAEVEIPVFYKSENLNLNYRIDLLVNKQIVLELKAVETINDIHKAQLLTYLKLSGYSIGYLLNFNTLHMKDGIHRFVL